MQLADKARVGKRYILEATIGAGAMGTVYRATDRLTGHTVALKRLQANTSLINDPDYDETAYRISLSHEFQTLAGLRHPNVIGVLDYGFDEKRQPFFTMTLLENPKSVLGASLDASAVEKIRFLIEILQALTYVHHQGILHRDLKPDNVLVNVAGQLKVLDFGVALTQPQEDTDNFVGTPAYIAPEVWRGDTPTAASDLFAVGVIAYELFAGTHPFFKDDSLKDYIQRLLTTLPDMSRITTITLPKTEATNPNRTQADETLPHISAQTRILPKTNERLVDSTPVEPNAQPQQTPSDQEQPSDLTSQLSKIIFRLLAKNPLDRYSDGRQAIRDLRVIIGEADHVESDAVRESFLQAAKFVGRDTELDKLMVSLSELRNKRGSLWLIGGESGVGKSRLMDEVRTRAMVQGALVVRGQAVAEGGAPYQLWQETLQRLLISTDVGNSTASVLQPIIPNISFLLGRPVNAPAPLDGAAAQQRLQLEIRDLLLQAANQSPDGLVILLEDLQWAGKDLDLLKTLLPTLARQRIMIVGTYRIDEDPTLPQKLPGSNEITLQRLDKDQTAQLSAAMLGVGGREPHIIDFLQRETEGNVFFMIEVVRTLAEEAGRLDQISQITLPAYVFASGIQKVLERRLEHLTPKYRPLLEAAAVAGRQLDIGVIKRLATEEGIADVEDWLTACTNALLLEFREERWRFAHDKLREHILSSLSSERRLNLYKQVAETIEAEYAATLDQHLHTLAYLWAQTEHQDKELHYSQLAGRKSLQLDAYPDAKRLLTRALELVEQEDRASHLAQIADLNIDLGRVYENLASFDQSKQHFETALTLAQQTNNPEQRITALLRLGWIAMRQGNPDQANKHSADAVTIATESNSLQGMARAQYLNAITHFVKGEFDQAYKLVEQALPTVRLAQDIRNEADILNAYGAIEERLGNFDKAKQLLGESSAIAGRIGYKSLQANVEGNLGHLMYIQKLYTEAEQHFTNAQTLFHDLGNVFGEAQTFNHLAVIKLAHNKGIEALPLLQTSLQLSNKINAAAVILSGLVGMARVWNGSGRRTEAAELLAFVLNHPAQKSDDEIEKEGRPVYETLEKELPPETFKAAVEKGQKRELTEVVAEALAFQM